MTLLSYELISASEFVSDTTANALVVGPTVTDSDGRIFTSDNGVQIGKFATSNTFYRNTCTDLIERMINTVPSSVTLTPAITPIPVKPNNVGIKINDDGTMTFFGEIRVCLSFHQ